ncbi:MAG: dTMP kinase [Candidatus Aenigmarchaeota archaeon]|nr:dTMP kinase [Candidatus Aenigmarchaeota archaeon]
MVFIVFEGIDGSGKTTQVKLLEKYLVSKNKSVLETVEPQKKPIGNLIKNLVRFNDTPKEAIALLFAADRVDHVKNTLIPNLDEYDFILCDRYYYSSYIYKSIQGCEEKWIEEINKYMIEPDLIILIDVDADDFLKRRGENKVIFENMEFQKKAKEKYLEFAKTTKKVVVIDGSRSVDEVYNNIMGVVNEKFNF